jgi:N-methylhydantoinase A
VGAAERAVGRLGKRVGLGLEAVAEGIVAVANAKMANAIRTLGLRRGIDPRDFTLLAFGGAGPLHGAALAEELGIQEVIVPFGTGVLSAWGMLHADVRHDMSAPFSGDAGAEKTRADLFKAIAELRSKGALLLAEEGVPEAKRAYRALADMRYAGQEHCIAVEISDTAGFIQSFHQQYRDRYGHNMPGAPVEFVNVRLAAIGRVGADCRGDGRRESLRRETARPIRIDGVWLDARVVHRDGMPSDGELEGPAVILEASSTTLVPPRWQARHERDGNLILGRSRS